jgi:hypothetical protein
VTEGAREQGRGVGGVSRRTAAWVAWSVCAVTLLILVSCLVLLILGWQTPLPQGRTPWRDQAVSLVGLIGAPILGGLIASRRPENPYGWLWLGFGLGLTLQLLAQSYSAYALVVDPGSLPAPRTTSRVLGVGGPLALTLSPFLLLLFPTGRLPSPRWRPLAWVSAFSGVVLLVLNFLFARPDTVGGVITAVTVSVVAVIFAAIVLSALSLIVRYRLASGLERQQLKWFALAAVLTGAFVVGSIVIEGLLGDTVWNLLDAVIRTALYLAVGVAILRYRLYEIDIIINRTLVYAFLTATLAAVYFGGVTATQALFRALTGQERQPQLAIVVSTLVIAALFNPLRRRVQAFVDRRFYRRKYDAAKTLAVFSAKLRDETDLDALNAELLGVVRETMQPAHVTLWLRPDTTEKKDEMPG